MESRKVRRPFRDERRPDEHFYQDFLKKLMIFCPPRKSCLRTSSSL